MSPIRFWRWMVLKHLLAHAHVPYFLNAVVDVSSSFLILIVVIIIIIIVLCMHVYAEKASASKSPPSSPSPVITPRLCTCIPLAHLNLSPCGRHHHRRAFSLLSHLILIHHSYHEKFALKDHRGLFDSPSAAATSAHMPRTHPLILSLQLGTTMSLANLTSYHRLQSLLSHQIDSTRPPQRFNIYKLSNHKPPAPRLSHSPHPLSCRLPPAPPILCAFIRLRVTS